MKHSTHIFLLLLVNLFALNVFSQNYPVQVTTILQSPFSGYVQDYSTLGNENLKVLITFQDFTKPSYSIKLKFKLSGQNITIKNKNYYFAGPFTIYPGVPLELSGSDLASMLNSNNLEFSGLSRNYYESAKVLPEGNYQICITAYDAFNPNNIQVSNNSCVNAWMMLNDPPFTNIPACGSIVTPLDPQNLLFQWSSMNLASPNSAFSTTYEFSLYEVRPKGANPNNIIQSLPPIYQTTTSLVSLNYGMTEPVLNLGMDYVWRVKAIDNSGRDLFKNNGYSQICTFTYGSMGNFIDTSALRLTLQGTPINYRMIKCFWDTMNVYKSYKLIYKKESGTNWFTTSGITKPYEFIQNLEEENTYKIYMKGILLDNTEGPASNTITITTPKKTDYACGQGLMSPAQNTKPLLAAQLGQVWEVGQFEVTVTHLNNLISSNGIYSGLGNVEIPFLGNFNVSFNNIMVNEQFQVIAGQVNVITKGIGRWLNSFNYPPGWNMTDSLRLNTPVSSATVNSSGQILINGSPVGNAGLNTVITGNDGSTVYVSANGSITIENNPKEAPVGNITQLEDSLAVVLFTIFSKTNYGYDAYDIKTETAGKDYLGLQKGEGVYKVPYKLLVTGTADIVKAKLIPGAIAINTNTIKFKRSDGTILNFTTVGSGDYEIALNGRLNLFADDIWAFAKKANSVDTAYYPVGKMALASVDKKVKKAKLIPVNGIGTGVNLQAYTQELNSIYKKAGVEWQLSIDSNLTVNSYDPDSTLMVSRNSLNTTYGTDLRNIINAYKANRTVSEDCSYLFLCNKATNSEMGYMALNKRFGFVFMQNNLQVEHSIAHELGHGALVLEHTFENGDQGPSQNVMDYNGGELFNHAQWLNIHDPKTLENIVNTLVQDEESGSYQTDGHYSTIYLIGKMLGIPQYKLLAWYTECWDNYIHDKYAIVQSTWAERDHQLLTHALTYGYHSIEEFISAVAFMNADINDYKEMGRLLHRYGDCYAHTRIQDTLIKIDQKRMYGDTLNLFFKIFGITNEHMHPDGENPDLISIRPNWYLEYVTNVAELLAFKFNKSVSTLNKNLFKHLAEYAKINKVSLIGIINYHIAKLENKNYFVIPYPISNGGFMSWNASVSDQTSYETWLENTKKYLDFIKIKYKITRTPQTTVPGNKNEAMFLIYE